MDVFCNPGLAAEVVRLTGFRFAASGLPGEISFISSEAGFLDHERCKLQISLDQAVQQWIQAL